MPSDHVTRAGPADAVGASRDATSPVLTAPRARFDDAITGRSLVVDAVREEIAAHRPEEVRPALRAVQRAVAAGEHVVLMVSAEAAPGLDPAARVHPSPSSVPLVWAGICDAPRAVPPPVPRSRGERPYHAGPWRPSWTYAEYAERVARVREAIAAGDTYQANLTTSLHGRVTGDLHACYLDLAAAQRAAHATYLDLGEQVVLSASPELFLRWDGDLLTARPMKGTAPRGADPAADAAARSDLLASPKERAENVMITDLLRNDLARVARPGSVAVPSLLQAEAFPTVWQLTSTVTARARTGLDLEDLLAATFPCGSVTGAPKLSTLDLLADLEDGPRGVYCGALGLLSPARVDADGTHPASLRLSVPIRTLTVDRRDGRADYGVGSGITWASDAAAEWAELAVKARVLDAISGERPPPLPAPADPDAFDLLETLAVVDGAPRHLVQHLDRLEASAARFARPLDREQAAAAVRAEAAAGDRVLRLALDAAGTLRITHRPLPPPASDPVHLALDSETQDPDHPAVRHKTSQREHYDRALARVRAQRPEAEDAVLRGRDGRVTETTIASLLVRSGGRWWTPPLEDGCLPGVARGLALAAGEVGERPITVAELRDAEEIALLSSVRGRRPAVLLPDPA